MPIFFWFLFLNSIDEFGLWFDITHFEQNLTSLGNPKNVFFYSY